MTAIFFSLFLIQRLRALNTIKKVKKKGKGLRHYIVWQPGKMPQPKSSCRKHSAQSHAWATKKMASLFHLPHIPLAAGSNKETKTNIQWPKQQQQQLRKPWEFWQCFYFNTRKQHVRWLSISNRITLTSPVYICIYIQGVPYNMNKALNNLPVGRHTLSRWSSSKSCHTFQAKKKKRRGS